MVLVLSRNLHKKKILSTDGKMVGTLKNLRVDLTTGQIVDMLIRPDPRFSTEGYQRENDHFFLSFESVKDIKDYIVVDRYLERK